MANEPITRQEQLLNAVATGEAVNIKPITREEMFLAKAGGQDVQTPTPITRREMFLNKIAENGGGGSGGGDSPEEWFNDGDTHIWITLPEGRTSPMLGICPNGTVTVDWGDGTEPDVLTGTALYTVKWTPSHEYAVPGDYIIRISVDGNAVISGHSNIDAGAYIIRYNSSDSALNRAYQTAIRRVEIGKGIEYLGGYAFQNCSSITSVHIPNSISSIGAYAFQNCYALKSINVPDGVTTISNYAFANCYALESLTLPDGLSTISGYAFQRCYLLKSITIPESVKNLGNYAFENCHSLAYANIPDGVTALMSSLFYNNYSLDSVTVPSSVANIYGHAFYNCYSLRFYDFSKHTTVPALQGSHSLSVIDAGCKILVPAALYDEWIAATNWSTFADNIVAV